MSHPRPTLARKPSASRVRPRASRATALVLVAAVTLATGCGRNEPGDSGGAATGDDLGSREAGSALSNDSAQRDRPVNDTLPGRDSRVRQPAGQSAPARP